MHLKKLLFHIVALDAYCLLEVYDSFELHCGQMGIPFYDVCLEVQHFPHHSPQKNVKGPPQKVICIVKILNYYLIIFSNIFLQPRVNYGTILNDDTHETKSKKYLPFKNHNVPKNQYAQHLNNPLKPKCMEQVNRPHYNTQKTISQFAQQEYQAVHKFRVVCDSLLGGLSNKLRICGCDCVHVAFDQDGERAAKQALNENRILLTRNKGYLKVKFLDKT